MSVKLPVELPFNIEKSGGVNIPLTLPFVFGDVLDGKISLPITLPFKFGELNDEIKTLKIPTKEYVEEEGTKTFKIPVIEQSWHFFGLIIDENVIEKMSHNLTIIEDVRSRILTNVKLINRNTVRVEWFGDSVPKVGVYKKMVVDDKFELIKVCEWEDEYLDVSLDNSEYEILLQGLNGTGESGIVSVGETNYLDVKSNINVAINEKIYSFDIDFASEYKININL